MKKQNQTFWYPFRSKEVEDICTHLTPEERERLNVHASTEGKKMGILAPFTLVPVIFVGATLSWGLPAETKIFLATFGILITGLILGYFAGKRGREKSREILCSTQYAVQNGIIKETLKLYSMR